MKRLVIVTIAISALVLSSKAAAQKIIIGERAPELRIEEWLDGKPQNENKARLIDFFYSSNKGVDSHLRTVADLAKNYGSKIDVIVVCYSKPSKEVESKLRQRLSNYYVGVDEQGRSFKNFAVQYVPFSVLIDAKGRVRWSGNPDSLSGEQIANSIR